jgi:hypothetical protein
MPLESKLSIDEMRDFFIEFLNTQKQIKNIYFQDKINDLRAQKKDNETLNEQYGRYHQGECYLKEQEAYDCQYEIFIREFMELMENLKKATAKADEEKDTETIRNIQNYLSILKELQNLFEGDFANNSIQIVQVLEKLSLATPEPTSQEYNNYRRTAEILGAITGFLVGVLIIVIPSVIFAGLFIAFGAPAPLLALILGPAICSYLMGCVGAYDGFKSAKEYVRNKKDPLWKVECSTHKVIQNVNCLFFANTLEKKSHLPPTVLSPQIRLKY